jgi:hypothetical protein
MQRYGPFMGPQTLPPFLIMTQTKTKTVLSMGRIPQLFGHAVLAAGMLAGGASVLNAGGAEAACPPVSGSPTNWSGNIGTVSATNVAGSLPGTADCSLVSQQTNVATFDTDFETTGAGGLFGPTTLVYSYQLTTTTPGHWFDFALVDSDLDLLGAGGNIVRKDIFATSDFTQPPIFSESSNDGSNSGLQPIPGQYSTIYVRDTITLVGGAGGTGPVADLDNVTNTFTQVPGPLPILGAGAAFGFSRKLRGRIKAARLA